MKHFYSTFIFLTLLLGVSSLSAQKAITNNTATNFHLFAGYGTHGVVVGGDYRFFTAFSEKAGTRVYLDVGFQTYKFNQSFIFEGTPYNSDTKIVSWGAGIAEEFYISPIFHLSPFLGVRFETSHFIDSYINEKIGDGELVRYWDGVEVGSRLNKDYGNSPLSFDIGVCANLRIVEHIWIIGKAALSPIKYDNDKTIYGKYWANTSYNNPYEIKRSMFRAEGSLCFGF